MMKKQIHLLKIRRSLTKLLFTLAISVLSSNTNNLLAQNWDQVVKAVASDRAVGDLFGYSVSISGDYAIVGAKFEDHNAVGSQFLENAGAAYILKNNSGIWTVVQKIVASDRATDDEFGTSVAISGDFAIVGAPRKTATVGFELESYAGAAYIFKNIAGTWSQVNKLLASDREYGDEFGYSVAISSNYAIVGAPFEDHSVTGTNAQSNKGSAYIYKRGETIWTDEQKIVSISAGTNDVFGNSVGITDDYAIIGMPKDGVSSTSGVLVEAGSAVIYLKNTSGNWTEMQKLNALDKGAGDQFGYSVAISGDNVIVGALFEDHNLTGGANLYSAGSAYIFERNGGTWAQMDKLIASDREESDNFGVSVSISGEYAVVGAYNEDHDQFGGNYIFNPGSAYIFKNTSGNWAQENKIVASDRAYGNQFGNSVAISGDLAIVGAFMQEEDQLGGNSMYLAGAAYFFKNCRARSTDTQTACNQFTWIDGNTYTENNNTATFNIVGGAASGCDSLITLNLTINTIDVSTSLSGNTITANASGASYQWIDCNNGNAIIPGATAQSFTATANGSYSVIVTTANCSNTSACQAITTVGIDEMGASAIEVYPNPTSGTVKVFLGELYPSSSIQLFNALGQVILHKDFTSKDEITFEIEGATGVYFLEIKSAEQVLGRVRVVKN